MFNSTLAAMAAFIAIVVAATVILYSTFLVVRLRRRGQLERIFARAVVDSEGRRSLMVGMMIINATFLCTGLLFALTTSRVLPDGVGDMLVAVTFASGAFMVLIQVYRGLRLADLSLQNEWDLQDVAPDVLRELSRSSTPARPHGTLFVPEPARTSRTEVPAVGPIDPSFPQWLLYR